MFEKWNDLTKKDQNLVLVLICALMIGVYTGAVYLSLGKDIFEMQNLVSRKENRLGVQNKSLGIIGEDATVYEKKLKEIDPILADYKSKYEKMERSFVPLDQPVKVEALRLEIAEYARYTSVAITTMSTLAGRDKNSTIPPDESSKQLALTNQFNRQLISVSSYATFSSLLKFLDGMDELSYYASVVRIDIKAVIADLKPNEFEKPSVKKLIQVDMIIAI